MSVPKWLKHYVFLRMLPNDKKKNLNAKAALTTFMVSAVWHGFYPGFYLFFSGAFLLDTQAKLSGQVIYPLIKDKVPEFIISAVSWVWCYTFCAYFAIAFILLSLENAHKVYGSMYYSGHIILVLTILVLHTLAPKNKSKTIKPTNNE